jgi:vancomycin permeability regulator SanA
MKIILVLGSPNADDGTLSEMALSRLDVCIGLYQNEPFKIILTGGFGAHFNKANKPHAFYLKQKLLSLGVPMEDILAIVEASNSVEDATLSKWIIEKYSPEEIIIVTSDYHFERAKLIFETVYAPFANISFALASSSGINGSIIDPLILHEKVSIKNLMEYGVRF